MTAYAEQQVARGIAWHEPAAFPMLADYECQLCGLIPGIEVEACSCGRAPKELKPMPSDRTHVAVIPATPERSAPWPS